MLIELVTGLFVLVHGVDGQEFYINPEQITTLREPVGRDVRHFPPGTHCVIVMTNGKFAPVREKCSEVYSIVETIHP